MQAGVQSRNCSGSVHAAFRDKVTSHSIPHIITAQQDRRWHAADAMRLASCKLSL
jgi:hypothetical protein